MIEIEKGKPEAGGDPSEAAAEAFAKALKSGKGKAIVDAYREFVACCEEAEMGDDEEDDDE